MGFSSGFSGGVTLTLGIAYLTTLSHQRNRQSQCDVLRNNISVLRALANSDPITAAHLGSSPEAIAVSDPYALPIPYYYYQTRPSPSYSHDQSLPHPSFIDELKSSWNAHLVGAARGIQTTDWFAVREDALATFSRLWNEAVGSNRAETAGSTVAVVAETVVADAQSTQVGTVGRISSAQNRASETAQAVTKSITQKSEKQLTEVERALKQRYAKLDESVMRKNVGELLEERYNPMKQ